MSPFTGTRLVDVVYIHTDPEFAAGAANTLAEEYIAQNLDQRLSNTGNTLDWVNAELLKATEKVKESENALAQYRESNNAQSLDSSQNMVVARLTSLNETVTRARTERQAKETAYNQVRAADPATDAADNYSLIGNNTAVVLAQGQLAQLKGQLESVSQNYEIGRAHV